MANMGGFDLNKLMKQVKETQEKFSQVQGELKERVVEATAGGGMVTVRVNGKQEVLDLKIDRSVLKEDPEILEELIIAAVNEGLRKAKKLFEEEIGKITGGLPIPGLFS